jgi:hypothetical protein
VTLLSQLINASKYSFFGEGIAVGIKSGKLCHSLLNTVGAPEFHIGNPKSNKARSTEHSLQPVHLAQPVSPAVVVVLSSNSVIYMTIPFSGVCCVRHSRTSGF